MKLKIIKLGALGILGILGVLGNLAFAQSDSALNRSVTVERDFQPILQAAGKIATKPAVVETTIEPAPVEYSAYTAKVTPEAAINPMLSQPTRFEPGRLYNGYLRGALGHPVTRFDFGYHLDDGKKSVLDVYAHHDGEWCREMMLSKTKLGLVFTHNYAACDLYFGVNGGNIYYHRYGDLYDPAQPKNNTNLWSAEVYMGVKANAKQEVQYLVQTGYQIFAKANAVSEHQIRTKASFDWHADAHHVGTKLYVQNNFLQLSGDLAAAIDPSLYNTRHAFRIEPYYAYVGKRVLLHAGVNIDMNIGCGRNALSGTENISFAPSPHVYLEAQIAKPWLTLYADITGHHGMGNLQEFMENNRYRKITDGITEHHPATYVPVDGELGLRIRPHRDLFVELHGGYAVMRDEEVWIYNQGEFDFLYTNYNRGKIGGEINYHYRDIVRINLDADYFIWSGAAKVYDRPSWKIGFRVDGRIDEHWSLYSENKFEGSRLALAYDAATNSYSTHTLKPHIDLDLGVQYEMVVGKSHIKHHTSNMTAQVLRPEPKPNLTLFLQLENFIHRKNEIYYGFHAHGITALLGASYRF
jgi:hypothetical protein